MGAGPALASTRACGAERHGSGAIAAASRRPRAAGALSAPGSMPRLGASPGPETDPALPCGCDGCGAEPGRARLAARLSAAAAIACAASGSARPGGAWTQLQARFRSGQASTRHLLHLNMPHGIHVTPLHSIQAAHCRVRLSV